MWFSRIWVVLLAIAVAGLLAVALLLPRPAARDLTEADRQSLDRLQHNTELLLKLESRIWIDRAATLASDPAIIQALEQANDGARDLSTVRARATSRLLEMVSQVKPEDRPKLLILVDRNGKQLARVGPGEDKFRPGVDGLAGFPLVGAALRGYKLDDSWSHDNVLYFMAASPVVSAAKGRYIGALLVGQEVNTVFANKLRARLGANDVHLAFYLRGQMAAATVSSPTLARLPQHFSRLSKQIAKHGRSAVLQLGTGSEAHSAILAPIRGEAGAHDAFYAVVGPPPVTPAGLGQAIGRVKTDPDLKGFPWPIVIGLLVVAVGVGVGLSIFEVSRPIHRLLEAVRAVSKGETTRLEPGKFPGTLRFVAHAINEALDRSARRAPAADKDLQQILGSPEDAATRPDLQMDSSGAAAMPPLADSVEPAGVQALSGLSGNDGGEYGQPLSLPPSVGVAPAFDAPDNLPPLDAMPTLEPEENATLLDEPASPQVPLLPPVSLPDTPDVGGGGDTSLPPPLDASNPFETASAPGSFPFTSASDPEDAASSLKVRVSASGGGPSAPPTGIEFAEDSAVDTVMSSVPQMLAQKAEAEDGADAEQSEYRRVFEDFVTIKKQCGESVETVTFERFSAKLRKNRDSLMDRYGCKTVKFQVYVKDGKAALKATPVKE